MTYFIERQKGGERGILVCIDLATWDFQESLSEFQALAISAGVEILDIFTSKQNKPTPTYFIGRGKVEILRERIVTLQADLIIFNHNLTPAQARNLEKTLHCYVIDRTGLILDIFAQRAHTFEGKLQVELAQLKHLSTRLVRGWTHLERQKGGIGLRGPGETQLETDRRLVAKRIKSITKKIEKVSLQREQNRKSRLRASIPVVALVGYTNAGKSTLFNELTGETVYASKKLFATLDPTLRQIQIPHLGKIILADTVGFVRDLPHDLVAAFRATLEETRQADLLLHIIDAHSSERETMIQAVNQVLLELDADKIPIIQVFNKIDLCQNVPPHVDAMPNHRVWCSAVTGEGLPLLLNLIAELLSEEIIEKIITLSPSQGNVRAELYERDVVISESIDEAGNMHLTVRMPYRDFLRL